MAYTTTRIESAGATRYIGKHAGDGYLVPRPGRERFAASPGVHIPKAVGRVGSLGGLGDLAVSIACSHFDCSAGAAQRRDTPAVAHCLPAIGDDVGA